MQLFSPALLLVRRRLSALVLALALALVAAALPPAAATPAHAAVVAEQVAASAEADTELHTVEQAFNLLMDQYVHPLDSAALLQAGWSRLATAAADAHAPAPAPLPALAGVRAADLDAVRAALTEYLTQNQNQNQQAAGPPGFSPAYAVVRGMVGFVNEGHTYFLEPKQYQEYQEWMRGQRKYVGIGVGLNTRGVQPTIAEVYEDTPAARAGLRPGDVIDAINGRPLAGIPAAEVTGLMRGPVDTSVQLTVERAGEAAPLTFALQRAEISLAFVNQKVIGDDIGYVVLRGFPEPSVDDAIENDIASFQQQGVRGLVLDLRGNSGGRIDVGTRLLSHFVPAGTGLFEQIDRAGHERTDHSRDGARFGLPLVVLVDGATASMGEIFAAAVQEQGVGTVVGSTTAGSVAGSQVFGLGDGSGLQVTVFEIKSAEGHQLNGVGVVPDETVDADPAGLGSGSDPALSRAVEILRSTTPAAAVPGTGH